MSFNKVHIAMLRSAALLVPAPERAEWFAEWKAELWYVDHSATRFCLGSFRDASWLRHNSPTPNTRRTLRLQSASHCVLVLGTVAAASVLLAFCLHFEGDRRFTFSEFLQPHAVFTSFLVLILFSSLELLAVAPIVGFGEYPVNRYAPAAGIRLRRWFFLVLKLALIALIALFGSMNATILHVPPAPLFGIAFIFGFRWALLDQRHRCPVCLSLLSNPIPIGGPSQTFLGWYGTELVCTHGHGILYIPEISTSWHRTQRWQYLDPSWSSLPS